MRQASATIRQLRTDFRSVKRMVEEHGEIIITDRGYPAYVLKPLPEPPKNRPGLPDYHKRLLQQRSQSMSETETLEFWEEARGGR